MLEMPWQELVFLVGNIVFTAALIPSILSKDKPSFWTCALTAPVITLFSFTFVTLDMDLSAFGIGTVGLAWWILFIQTIPHQSPVSHRTDT